MKALVPDPLMSDELIAARKSRGIDRHDEVWEGVYVIPPMPNNEHQRMVLDFSVLLHRIVGNSGTVLPGANVSDRDDDWDKNYRCPDVLVALTGGAAVDRGTYWLGGPDFVVEIRSPGDDTLEKIPFYAAVGVREVLVVERDDRTPTLFRFARKRLAPAKPADLDGGPWLVSAVLQLAFRRVETKARGPKLEVRRTTGRPKTWKV